MFGSQYFQLLFATALVNALNPFTRADQNLHRHAIITSIYSAEDFDLLQSCSKWCLDGGCHDGQGTPGCSDFIPITGSANDKGLIQNYGCSQPGCICDPVPGYYQRTIDDAYKCLQTRCRREGTSDSAFKTEADQVEKTIRNYCIAHNVTADITAIHPTLATSTTTTVTATFTATVTSTPQENTGWKPQDIAAIVIAVISCLAPFFLSGIKFHRARQLRRQHTSAAAENPNPNPPENMPLADLPAENRPSTDAVPADSPSITSPFITSPFATSSPSTDCSASNSHASS